MGAVLCASHHSHATPSPHPPPNRTGADDAVGNGGAAAAPAGAAAAGGRATLGVLACVCRDLRDFGSGLGVAFEAAAAEASQCSGGSGGSVSSGPLPAGALLAALHDGLAAAVDAEIAKRRDVLAGVLGRCLREAFQVGGREGWMYSNIPAVAATQHTHQLLPSCCL